MHVPVNRHPFALLPPLHRRHVAVQVGRDLLPRVQSVLGRLRGWRCVGESLAHQPLLFHRPGFYLYQLGNGIVQHSTASAANSCNPAPYRLTAPPVCPIVVSSPPGVYEYSERTTIMTLSKLLKPAAAATAFAAILLAAMLNTPPRVKATDDDDDNSNDSRIQRGFDIAPVHLNLEGKNRALVGLGSYIVNANVPCNECHGAGPALNQFLPGDNPYFGQTAVIDPPPYLGGGRRFPPPLPASPVTTSPNLTPPKTA